MSARVIPVRGEHQIVFLPPITSRTAPTIRIGQGEPQFMLTPALFEQLRGPHDFSFALWDRRWVHIYRHMGWFLGNPYLTLEFASKEQATRYGSILCYTFAMAARRRA